MDRRTLILGAAFGTAVPSLVRAQSLLDMPGDPLTARGLFAASKWAEQNYSSKPAVRVAFADGQTTNWHAYDCLGRPGAGGGRTYAVAIEVSACDGNGVRFITSVPVDGAAAERAVLADRDRRASVMRELWQAPHA